MHVVTVWRVGNHMVYLRKLRQHVAAIAVVNDYSVLVVVGPHVPPQSAANSSNARWHRARAIRRLPAKIGAIP